MPSKRLVLAVVCVALVVSPALGAAKKDIPRHLVIEPELTDEVLINPLSGWQKLCHQGPLGEIAKMPEIGTYYFRACWNGYQTGPDKYDGHAVRTIDNWLDYCKKEGRYFGIRVVTYNSKNPTYQRADHAKWQGCDSAIPTSVWQAGAKGFKEPGGHNNWVPCFWDKTYLDEMEKLVQWMGKRWANHPNLAFVDIGGGNWGEMNLRNTGIPSLDDLSVWRKNGLTEVAWHNMIVRLVDMYKKAFPRQHLIIAADFASYGKGDETMDCVLKNGVGFRDDGLGMGYSRGGRKNREFMKHWRDVLCIFENGYSDWTYGGWGGGVESCLNWAIDECHAGIVMVGKGAATINAYNTHKDLVTRLGKKVGYRYEIQKAAYFSHPRKKQNFVLQLIVNNAGNIPCYFEAQLEVALMTNSGQTVFKQRFDTAPPIRTWMPGKPVRVVAAFKIPANSPTGKLALCIGIVRKDYDPWRIQLPLEKDVGDRLYMIGTVTVRGTSTSFTKRRTGPAADDAPSGPSEGPLAAYAAKLGTPLKLEAARDFAGAAKAYEDLAASAGEPKAKDALAELARSARGCGELKKHIIDKAGKGKPVPIYVSVAGRKSRGKVKLANDRGVKASVTGMEMTIKWRDVEDSTFLRLALSYGPKTAESRLAALDFAARRGLDKQMAKLATEIQKKWPASTAKVREIMKRNR